MLSEGVKMENKDLNGYADLALKSVIQVYLMYLVVDKGLSFNESFMVLGEQVGGICGDFLFQCKVKEDKKG